MLNFLKNKQIQIPLLWPKLNSIRTFQSDALLGTPGIILIYHYIKSSHVFILRYTYSLSIHRRLEMQIFVRFQDQNILKRKSLNVQKRVLGNCAAPCPPPLIPQIVSEKYRIGLDELLLMLLIFFKSIICYFNPHHALRLSWSCNTISNFSGWFISIENGLSVSLNRLCISGFAVVLESLCILK